MNVNDIKPGIWVKVHTLGSTRGFLINPKNLGYRREGAVGQVMTWVPGHGGDVWWVQHHDNPDEIAPYGFPEIEQVDEPPGAPDPESILD